MAWTDAICVPVNWFTTVVVEEGTSADTSRRAAGHCVTLRAELDTLVILGATPHPLEPADEYAHGQSFFIVTALMEPAS